MSTKTRSLENWKHLCRNAGAVDEDYVTVPGTNDSIHRYLGPNRELIGVWNMSWGGPGFVHEAPFQIAKTQKEINQGE